MFLPRVLSLETFKQEETKKEKTHMLTIKENHCSFFYKSLVLLQLEHSGNMYALITPTMLHICLT